MSPTHSKVAWLLLAACLLTPISLLARRKGTPGTYTPTTVQQALITLGSTRLITSKRAGEMIRHPKEIIAFNTIYHRRDAKTLFRKLYEKSRTAGKMYAIFGLSLLKDRSHFNTLKARFLAAPQEKIDVRFGCKGMNNADAKWMLKTWLTQRAWYTAIVLKQK